MNKALLLMIMAWKIVTVAAMRIATSTTGTDMCHFYKESIFNSTKTIVAIGKVKVETSGSTSAQTMQLTNGVRRVEISFKNGSVILGSLSFGGITHTIDTSVDHDYEMRISSADGGKFYIDGALIHSIAYASLQSNTSNSVYFGDIFGSANIGGSVLWKSFKYNLDFVGTPTTFTEWLPTSLPSAQGWTVGGTAGLATIVEV